MKSKLFLLFTFAISFSLYASPLDKTETLVKAETFRLDNGLIVVAKNLPASRLAAIQMWVKGGLRAEGEFLGSGISHFLEHMLFKGTDKRGPGEIAEEIHRLGGEINAGTSLDYTCYKIILPREHLAKGLELLADAIRNSNFPEEEFKREREVILKEINMNDDDPSRRLWHIFLREAFTAHPYREPILGNKEFFEHLRREDMVNFYKTRYLPQQMVLAMAGGIDRASIKEKVEAYFKDWRVNSNLTIPFMEEPRQLSPRKTIEVFSGEKAYLRLGFHIPGVESEDLYSLDLLSFIIGRGKGSRLYGEIKERKGLADSISASSFTPSSQGVFMVEAISGPDKLDALDEAILQEIEEIKKNGVREEELNRARKILKAEYNLSQEKVEEVAGDIGYNRLILGEANFGEYYIRRLGQVKREDLREVARRYLRKENLTMAILSPPKPKAGEEIEREVEHIGNYSSYRRIRGVRGHNLMPLKGVTGSEATTRGGDPDGSKLRSGATNLLERVIHKQILPANLILLTSPSEISPMVRLHLLFRGGVLYEEKEKSGLFSLLARTLIRSTKKKGYLELHSEVESRGGELSSYSGYNSFGLSLSLAKEDLPWGIGILASLLREPAFKEEDIAKAREELEAGLKIEDDNILTGAFYLFRETMFNDHPYAWRDKGTADSLKKITPQDLFSIYQNYCLGQAPILAIFGHIDEREVTALVENNFSFLKMTTPVQFKPLPAPLYRAVRKEVSLPREQAILIFGFPGVSISDNDRFSLEVMTAILSGQSGRLFRAIREKKGEAYYLGAYQILGLVPGALVFYAGTTPEKVKEIEKEMEREIERLKVEELSISEIDKAKEILIGDRRIALEGNSSLAMDSALNELYGLGFNFYLDYESNIKKVDAAMIKAVARRYLKPEIKSCLLINSP